MGQSAHHTQRKHRSLLLWIHTDCSRGHLSSPHSHRHFFLSKPKKNAAVSEGTFGISRRSNGPTAVFRSKDWFYLFYHNTLFIHLKAVRNNILSSAMTCLTLPKQECKSLHLNEGSIHKRCYMCGQLSQTVDWSGAFSVLLAKGGTDWWQKWDQSHRGQG